MTGKHRAPSPLGPLSPAAVGATLAAASLLITGVATAASPTRPVHTVALPPVMLPLPPLTVASAAWYLTPLPQAPAIAPAPSTPAVVETVSAKQQHLTIKTTGTTGGIAARAVSAVMNQIGTPYVWGGAAPGGFDCSGLVQWAFKGAGVTLPRTAAAQATTGRPVDVKDLQPGDLLFFYRPVDHVVVYVGDGKIAEASQPGVPVHVRPMYLNGFVGARRVIG